MVDALPDPRDARFISELGAKAAGRLEFTTLELPSAIFEEAFGLPGEIPVAMRTGQNPELLGVSQLFEAWRTCPSRKMGTAKATTLEAFVALVDRHKTEDSVIFGATDWPAPKLTAIIDYHKAEGPRAQFCRHRVEYGFPLTEEFRAWIDADGRAMDQLAFAQFLEDHAAELADATETEKFEYEDKFRERFASPHELIGLSRGLEVLVGAKIKRQERLKTGERSIIFETQTTGANGEPLDVPGLFMIGVAAFVGGAPVRIPARLRFRPANGEIKWTYHLYRWRDWLRARVRDDLLVAASATDLPFYEGAPEIA